MGLYVVLGQISDNVLLESLEIVSTISLRRTGYRTPLDCPDRSTGVLRCVDCVRKERQPFSQNHPVRLAPLGCSSAIYQGMYGWLRQTSDNSCEGFEDD